MSFTLGVLRETAPGERRVALVPAVVARLRQLGAQIIMERNAGAAAGIPDALYQDVEWSDAAGVLARAEVLFKVRSPEAAEIDALRAGSIVIGFLAPHRDPERIRRLRDRRLTSFAVELIPRISRAQAMDALSSQAAAAGYRAVLIGTQYLDRFLPMLTTAAGTIRPAKVLVIGAGVAGLQAIATARRLGAIVEAFDVRAATREQVESLGARFIDTGVQAEAAGGYARELTEEEKRQQREALARHVVQADLVICTAAVPGRPAPRIVTRDMVAAMKAGAVLVDLAAESGGNCELTQPGETVRHGAVTIAGPLNVPSMLAEHASEMYARNLVNFLAPVVKDGTIAIDWNDEVYAQSVLTHDGAIRHEAARKLVEG